LIGLWILLMVQIASFNVKRPTWDSLDSKKALKCRFWPIFTYVLGLKANGYMREQL